jgi:hypothetical protein
VQTDGQREQVDAATAQSLQTLARSMPPIVGDDRAALIIGSLAMLANRSEFDHQARERDELIARVRSLASDGGSRCDDGG